MTFATTFKSDIPATTVHVRESWADTWAEVPYLYVDSLSYSIGGAFGQARLRYNYGWIKREGTTAYAQASKQTLDRYYVRITYTPASTGSTVQYWYGVIISATDESLGSSSWNSTSIEAGNQAFTAVTLDWLLTQKQITKSKVAKGNGIEEIDRPIAFNAGDGSTGSSPDSPIANCEYGPGYASGTETTPIFAENLENAEVWSAYRILLYLITYYSPSVGNDGPTWSLKTGIDDYLEWFSPIMPVEGRTLYDLVNALVDQRRGLYWYVQSTESGCAIVVNTYSSSAIELTNYTIPAHATTDITDIDTNKHAGQVLTITDSQQKYSQVEVTGARRGCCFTLGYRDGSLVEDWSSTDKAAYEQGDTAAVSNDYAEHRARNTAYRNSDALRHVFTRFSLAETWDGFAGDGWDYPASYVCPEIYPYSGELAGGGVPFWRSGIRFKKKLPLRELYDYRADPENPTNNAPTGVQPGFLDTFAVINIGNTYIMANQLGSWWENEAGAARGTACSCQVEVVPTAPALYVMPSSAPHAAADGEYLNFGNDYGSDIDTVYEYQTIKVTVFVEWDSYAAARYPALPGDSVNDQESLLTIRFGERARMDWLNKGTVLGVEENKLVRADVSGWIRNDHAILKDVAKTAWLWYSTPRKAVRLTIQHISDDLSIGDLIGDLGSETINSLVTSVSHDFTGGVTRLETQFANIDARQMIG